MSGFPEHPESLAKLFHELYERFAPEFNYETRKESAVPWENVPEKNRRLMVKVCQHILALHQEGMKEQEREIFETAHRLGHLEGDYHSPPFAYRRYKRLQAERDKGEEP